MRAEASGVYDGDPFLINRRQRSCSPTRRDSAGPSFHQDHESLVSLYTSTGGGSWRTSSGWPASDDVSRRPARQSTRSSSPSVEPAATLRNPFGELNASHMDKKKYADDAPLAGATEAARPAEVACAKLSLDDCCSGDGGSPGNPFAPERKKNVSPINPFRPAAASSPNSSPSGACDRVATERLTRGATPPAKPPPATAAAEVRRAMKRFPPRALRDASPPYSALGNRSVRGRSPSARPQPHVPGRSPRVDSPRKMDSEVLQAGAAWFGVSLGLAERVTELKLVDNCLVGSLPTDLDGLAMLRYLHLGRNTLSGTIPSSISGLENLEWLNLGENVLTGPVPASLSSLTRLAELNLSSNRLTGPLPREVCGMASLVSLQLSRNALEGFLPREISKLSSLGTLCLDHNRFSGPIPPGVAGMRALRELRLNHNELTGRIPLAMGKMKYLKILSLSNNHLRGSMPEGLISNLGATKVQDYIMPGNRLADVDTAMLLLRRPLRCRSDRWLLMFSLAAAYVDLGTDIGAAMTFYSASDTLSFILAVTFIVVPTGVMVASTMGAARGRDRNKKIILTMLQLRLAWEARDGLRRGRETRDYKTAKFVEACFEAAPQMLLQTVALVSLWNDNAARSSDVFVAFSILNSVFSVSWEAMSALDRGWAEEMVEERARQGTSWPCGASAHRWLVLLCLWVFHVCEVGLRGMSLAVLALALRGWSALVMLGVWGARAVIAKATEANDLKTTKVLIKALAACLLDSIWDRKTAYVAASVCTLVESSVFFAVAAVELRDKSTPLGQVMSDVAWTAGSIYALRFALDLWLRVPLHWGKLLDSRNLVLLRRRRHRRRSRGEKVEAFSQLMQPRPRKPTGTGASSTTSPAAEPRRPPPLTSIGTTPQPTPTTASRA